MTATIIRLRYATQRQVDNEVNRLVLKFMAEEDECDYASALRAVLTSHPDLARRYCL
jgi:hypothetical protein